ncbi:protein of unknown function [Paraburkholderia dioscoreae]|uniref:Uncharacterized protein n=1 Tax=Paraburkholderia dioscoreae TaxID=2604047 RepID=A0A5Q4ZFS9_9BURK|nr:protein of unknown function [Paraburkholderia dioscoreae]
MDCLHGLVELEHGKESSDSSGFLGAEPTPCGPSAHHSGVLLGVFYPPRIPSSNTVVWLHELFHSGPGTKEFARPLFQHFLKPRQHMLLAGFVVCGGLPDNLDRPERT